jgi:hypothetical protein
MSQLSDDKIINIASQIATANSVNYTEIKTIPTTDSTGSPAIEIKFVLAPGSSDKISGDPSARTVSQVVQSLADAGEERFPIVRYEYRSVTPSV